MYYLEDILLEDILSVLKLAFYLEKFWHTGFSLLDN